MRPVNPDISELAGRKLQGRFGSYKGWLAQT